MAGPSNAAELAAELASRPGHANLRSTLVRYMPYKTAGREAYEEANEAVLGGIDRLVAVWDGQPSGGKGGTGDAVEAARGRGVPVDVVWPDGARRERPKNHFRPRGS